MNLPQPPDSGRPPQPPTRERPGLPRRAYGRTGEQLSVIGVGGMLVANLEPGHASRLVAEAVERGVNYFDVAPSYRNAEEVLGPALAPYRSRVFLACKTLERTRDGARAELERSLERLRTDHFDLYQLHALSDVTADVDVAFGRGGALETLFEAKRTGRVRYLGFSAHSEAAALAALDRFAFDSVLFPVNFATYTAGDFGPRIMARAEAQGVARLALKAMARQTWPADDPRRPQFPKCWYEPITDPREAELALRFTLSLPVTAALPPGEEPLFRRALDIAATFHPLTPAEQAELNALAQGLTPVFSKS